MTLDQLVQVGILLIGFAGLMVPLHLQNRRKAIDQLTQMHSLAAWAKRHSRKDRRGFRELARRLVHIERTRGVLHNKGDI